MGASSADAEQPAQRAQAPEALYAAVYSELRRIASRSLRKERRDHTLRTTALAHEAYLRLVGAGVLAEGSRATFCAAAAQAIRHILVDYARHRRRLRRGGPGRRQVELDSAALIEHAPNTDVLDLDEALQRLEQLSPRQARVVELRFFGGVSEEEAAEVLGVSRRTIQLDWRGARAWLRRELHAGGGTENVL